MSFFRSVIPIGPLSAKERDITSDPERKELNFEERKEYEKRAFELYRSAKDEPPMRQLSDSSWKLLSLANAEVSFRRDDNPETVLRLERDKSNTHRVLLKEPDLHVTVELTEDKRLVLSIRVHAPETGGMTPKLSDAKLIRLVIRERVMSNPDVFVPVARIGPE